MKTITEKEITLTIPTGMDALGVQNIIDYIAFLKITAQNKATQKDVDRVAEETNKDWWNKNMGDLRP